MADPGPRHAVRTPEPGHLRVAVERLVRPEVRLGTEPVGSELGVNLDSADRTGNGDKPSVV